MNPEQELAEIRGCLNWGSDKSTVDLVRELIAVSTRRSFRINQLHLGLEAAIEECAKWSVRHAHLGNPNSVEYWNERERFFRSILHPKESPHD